MKEMVPKTPKQPAAPKVGAAPGSKNSVVTQQGAGGIAAASQKMGTNKVPMGPSNPRVRAPMGNQMQAPKPAMPMAGRQMKPGKAPG